MTIVSSIGEAMNYTAKNWFAKSLENGLKHPAEYAAKMMVVSLVSKDFINCGFYTYQSLNNKKIPEDKRGFVAALDLVNGFINVGGQIATFFLVDRLLIPKLQGKLFTGVLKNPKTGAEETIRSNAPLSPDKIYEYTLKVIREKGTELSEALKAEGKTLQDLDAKAIARELSQKIGHAGTIGKDITTGFGIVITALATTALIKRTLTPLIATPLAGMLKDNYMDKKSKKSDTAMTPAMVDATMPKTVLDKKV